MAMPLGSVGEGSGQPSVGYSRGRGTLGNLLAQPRIQGTVTPVTSLPPTAPGEARDVQARQLSEAERGAVKTVGDLVDIVRDSKETADGIEKNRALLDADAAWPQMVGKIADGTWIHPEGKTSAETADLVLDAYLRPDGEQVQSDAYEEAVRNSRLRGKLIAQFEEVRVADLTAKRKITSESLVEGLVSIETMDDARSKYDLFKSINPQMGKQELESAFFGAAFSKLSELGHGNFELILELLGEQPENLYENSGLIRDSFRTFYGRDYEAQRGEVFRGQVESELSRARNDAIRNMREGGPNAIFFLGENGEEQLFQYSQGVGYVTNQEGNRVSMLSPEQRSKLHKDLLDERDSILELRNEILKRQDNRILSSDIPLALAWDAYGGDEAKFYNLLKRRMTDASEDPSITLADIENFKRISIAHQTLTPNYNRQEFANLYEKAHTKLVNNYRLRRLQSAQAQLLRLRNDPGASPEDIGKSSTAAYTWLNDQLKIWEKDPSDPEGITHEQFIDWNKKLVQSNAKANWDRATLDHVRAILGTPSRRGGLLPEHAPYVMRLMAEWGHIEVAQEPGGSTVKLLGVNNPSAFAAASDMLGDVPEEWIEMIARGFNSSSQQVMSEAASHLFILHQFNPLLSDKVIVGLGEDAKFRAEAFLTESSFAKQLPIPSIDFYSHKTMSLPDGTPEKEAAKAGLQTYMEGIQGVVADVMGKTRIDIPIKNIEGIMYQVFWPTEETSNIKEALIGDQSKIQGVFEEVAKTFLENDTSGLLSKNWTSATGAALASLFSVLPGVDENTGIAKISIDQQLIFWNMIVDEYKTRRSLYGGEDQRASVDIAKAVGFKKFLAKYAPVEWDNDIHFFPGQSVPVSLTDPISDILEQLHDPDDGGESLLPSSPGNIRASYIPKLISRENPNPKTPKGLRERGWILVPRADARYASRLTYSDPESGESVEFFVKADSDPAREFVEEAEKALKVVMNDELRQRVGKALNQAKEGTPEGESFVGPWTQAVGKLPPLKPVHSDWRGVLPEGMTGGPTIAIPDEPQDSPFTRNETERIQLLENPFERHLVKPVGADRKSGVQSGPAQYIQP